MNEIEHYLLEQIRSGNIPRERAVRLLKQLTSIRSEIPAKSAAAEEPIAVIGMGCNFPGSSNISEFWNLLVKGEDAIRLIDRWDTGDSFYGPVENKRRSVSKWGGFLDHIDLFDSNFFDITRNQADSMDPQQRLFLEVAWMALEDGGYAGTNKENNSIGVFVGARASNYKTKPFDSDKSADFGEQYRDTLIGHAQNFIASWVSHSLNLKGPSLVVDTACSSSLVSIHLACQSLRNGECGIAIAGGVDILVSPEVYISLSQAKALSPNGKCFTFDRNANGYVPSEGAGAVLLKPLSAAVKDGDRIYGVIRGSAINNDARTMGITTPSLEAQKQVLADAYRRAGITPDKVSYIEAHGTGTTIGDPIEIKALSEVFEQFTANKQFCAIGSVKTNIGHLHSAAGVAGFIKTVLSMHHRCLPRTLNCSEPNPRLQFHNTPFYPNLVNGEWEKGHNSSRYAGVSSFGFGGTNCHIVIEEAPPAEEQSLANSHYVLTLSARSKNALLERVQQLSTRLEETKGWKIGDVCRSSNVGRGAFMHRLSYVVASETDLMEQLLETINKGLGDAGSEGFYKEGKRGKRPKTVFSFTGQGAQYAGMGRELYRTLPEFKKHMDECAVAMDQHLDIPLLILLYGSEDERLQETRYTQPVTFAIEYALARTWMELGVKPDMMIGHSVGEYAAACIGGGLHLEDAGRLIVMRARLMHEFCRRGKMVAVFTNASQIEKELESYRDSVSIAAINGERQTVVSGESERIDQLKGTWIAKGIRVVELHVSHAFHSPMMEPMLSAYSRELQSISFSDLEIPIVSNVTGKPIVRMDAAYWLEQITKPVLFAKGIEHIRAEHCDIILEVGPSSTLTAMTKQAMGSVECLLVHSLQKGQDDWHCISKSLSKMYLHGMVEPAERISGLYGNRIWLPTYPFEKKLCWSQTGSVNGGPLPEEKVDYPYFDRCVHSEERSAIYEKTFQTSDMVMRDHTVKGQYIIPGVTWMEMAATALDKMGYSVSMFHNVTFSTPLQCVPGKQTIARLEITVDSHTAYFKGTSNIGSIEEWSKHVSGTVGLQHSDETAHIDYEAIKSRCSMATPAKRIYERIRNTQIVHGPYYQSLQDALSNDNEVLVTLKLSDAAIKYNDGMLLHPALLDASTTAGNALARYEEWFETGEVKTYIPFHIDRVEVFGKLPAEVVCHFERINETKELISYRITLADVSGKVLLRMNKFSCKRIPDSAQFLRKGNQISELEEHGCMARLTWVKSDVPMTSLEANSRARIVFLDENGIGANIVNATNNTQIETIVVSQGTKFQSNGNQIRINPRNADDYWLFVRELQSRGLEIGQVLHLWSTNCDAETIHRVDDVMEHQYLGVYSLLFFLQALHRCNQTPRFSLKVIASNMVQLAQDEASWGIASSTLIGFVKSLTHEYPFMKAELIDVNRDSMSISDISAAILAHLPFVTKSPFIALRKGEVWSQKLEEIDASEIAAHQPPQTRTGGVYLITGGTGGIGLELALALSMQYAPGSKYVLLNRSLFPPREEWEEIVRRTPDTDPLAEKLRLIAEIERNSSEVIPIQADITNARQAERAIQIIKEHYGPITGVVHAAGTHSDALVRNKNEADMQLVLEAKVKGTMILDQLTSQEPLEFFAICSSVASIFGGLGQCDYSAANSFADGYALYRNKTLQRKTLTLNWSLWNNVGMARSDNASSGMLRLGLKPLDSRMASRLFLQSLELPYEQIILEDQIRKCRGATYLEGNIMQTQLSARGSTRSSVYEPTLNVHMVEQFVIHQIFEICDRSEIDPELEFLALGLESSSIVNLSETIGDKLGMTLYPTLLFEHPSPRRLADHLLEACYDEVCALLCTGTQLQQSDAEDISAEEDIQRYLVHRIAAVIGHRPEEIDVEADFLSIGLTSVDIVDLAGSMSHELNVSLYPTLLFEYVNVAALARHLLEVVKSVPATIAEKASEKPIIENAPSSAGAKATSSADRDRDIAVIGFQGRFPGSEDAESFWEGLIQNRDEVREITRLRFPNRSSAILRAGMLERVDEFDPYFFKISPKEAREMDPQQRLLLEGSWELFERAGYSFSKLNGSRTGVFVGVMNSDYIHEARKSGKSLGVGSGVSSAILANRISYFYNFKGPSMPIETACSSSLVSIHMACQSLRLGESEMAIAGGVNILLSPDYFVEFYKNGMLSKEGKCKAFDKTADGYVRGEGMGLLLLKPLSAAIRDNDQIYAVIKGSAVNHDGRTNGLSAPSPQSQAEVIKQAYENAGVHPETVTYIEAHGTGTPLGDPIEFEGLNRAFESFTDKRRYCALGAVKTNIGHLESAAGVAGIIKIILMLKNRMMPKSLHLNEINPIIDVHNSPFYLLKENKVWDSEKPRRAGISSFGYGGVNCHIVVEEYEVTDHSDRNGVCGKPELFVLSAYSEEALRQYVFKFEKFITKNSDNVALADMSYSLLTGRDMLPHVIAIVAENREDLLIKLNLCIRARSYTEIEHCDIRYIGKEGIRSVPADTDIDEYSPSERTIEEWVRLVESGGDPSPMIDRMDRDIWRIVYKRIIDYISSRDIEKFVALRTLFRGKQVIMPTYPFQRESFWFEEVPQDKPPVDGQILPLPCLELLHASEWRTNDGDTAISNGRDNNSIVILSESKSLSEKLSYSFERKGQSCHIIHMDIDGWGIAEEQLKQFNTANYMFVGSSEETGIGLSGNRPTLEYFLRTAKLMKHSTDNTCLWVVLFNSHVVIPTERNVKPEMSALWSMAKVVEQEYKHVTVRGIDVCSEESEEQICSYIEMEMDRRSPKFLAAYRSGQRWEQTFNRISVPGKNNKFNPNGKVFWITGGLGDIGLSVAEYLAKKGKCTIFLTGRSSMPDRTEWNEWTARYGSENPTSLKIAAIQTIERLESIVELAPGDVTNIEEMSSIMRRISSQYGKLHWVFHLAGIAGKGKPIYKLEPYELYDTLDPKTIGIQVMDQVTREEQLEIFIAYSSLSSVAGGIGMFDYSAANAYLSAYTQRRKQLEGKPSIAVDWPLFKEIGMGTRTSNFNGKNRRENAVTAKEASQLLETILEDNRSYYVVSESDHLLSAAFTSSKERFEAKSPEFREEAQVGKSLSIDQSLLTELIRIVAGLVEAPEAKIAPDAPIDDFGIDSQMRLQLLESLEDRFTLDLPLTLFTDCPTLIEVAQFIKKHLSGTSYVLSGGE